MSDIDRVSLLAFIKKTFTLEELSTLCFELDVSFDDLAGQAREGKARELIIYLENLDRTPDLMAALARKRPTDFSNWFGTPLPPGPGGEEERKDIPAWIIGALALIIVAVLAGMYSKWSNAKDSKESTLREPIVVNGTDTVTLEATDPISTTHTPSTTPQMTESPPDLFGIRTVLLPDGTKVEQVLAPGGSFKMGSSRGEEDESPLHEVAVNAFWLDRSEVTNRQFAEFIEATGYTTTAELEGSGRIYADNNFRSMFASDWRHPNGSVSDLNGLEDHPAVLISWIDADKYCRWAGGRLPTEAEWEYAARGPKTLTYPWGYEFDGLRANFCDRSCPFDWASERYNDGYEFTSPISSFPEGVSWIGAEDMAGNVWEWVKDWYAEDYYVGSPELNPSGPQLGQYKILRGGAWASSNSYGLRTSAREFNYPDYSDSSYGFRCAYEN